MSAPELAGIPRVELEHLLRRLGPVTLRPASDDLAGDASFRRHAKFHLDATRPVIRRRGYIEPQVFLYRFHGRDRMELGISLVEWQRNGRELDALARRMCRQSGAHAAIYVRHEHLLIGGRDTLCVSSTVETRTTHYRVAYAISRDARGDFCSGDAFESIERLGWIEAAS